MEIIWALALLAIAVTSTVIRLEGIQLNIRHIWAKLLGRSLPKEPQRGCFDNGCTMLLFRVILEPIAIISANINGTGDHTFAKGALLLLAANFMYLAISTGTEVRKALEIRRLTGISLSDQKSTHSYNVLTLIPRIIFLTLTVYIWYLFLVVTDFA